MPPRVAAWARQRVWMAAIIEGQRGCGRCDGRRCRWDTTTHQRNNDRPDQKPVPRPIAQTHLSRHTGSERGPRPGRGRRPVQPQALGRCKLQSAVQTQYDCTVRVQLYCLLPYCSLRSVRFAHCSAAVQLEVELQLQEREEPVMSDERNVRMIESPEKSKKGSRRRGLATAGATKRIAPAARSTGAVGASVAGRERARDCAAAVSWRPRSSTSPLLPRTRVALDRMYARVHLEPATSHSRSRAASASERSVQRRAARSFPRTSALCDCSQQRWRPLRRFRH
jgi:hypothetical protein